MLNALCRGWHLQSGSLLWQMTCDSIPFPESLGNLLLTREKNDGDQEIWGRSGSKYKWWLWMLGCYVLNHRSLLSLICRRIVNPCSKPLKRSTILMMPDVICTRSPCSWAWDSRKGENSRTTSTRLTTLLSIWWSKEGSVKWGQSIHCYSSIPFLPHITPWNRFWCIEIWPLFLIPKWWAVCFQMTHRRY